jgi:DNA-binding MarR family transcriptional regulator
MQKVLHRRHFLTICYCRCMYIFTSQGLMKRSKKTNETEMGMLSAVRLPCASANLRRAARVVTQFYEEALRPTGMRSTQFTLLQALTLLPRASQKQLAELLGMDSTTLTRTLALLRKQGWVTSKAGDDHRELRLDLTAAGIREYKRTLPYWQSAQSRLKHVLGESALQQMIEATVRAAESVPRSE